MRRLESVVHFVEHLLRALHGVGPVLLLRFGIDHQREVHRIRERAGSRTANEKTFFFGGGEQVSLSAVRTGTHSEFEHRLRRPRRVVAAVAVAEVRGEGDREADVVSGAGNRRGMRAG